MRNQPESERFRLALSGTLVGILCAVVAAVLGPLEASAADPKPSPHPHGTADEIGRKLANPVSDVWALFTEFDVGWNDGETGALPEADAPSTRT